MCLMFWSLKFFDVMCKFGPFLTKSDFGLQNWVILLFKELIDDMLTTIWVANAVCGQNVECRLFLV